MGARPSRSHWPTVPPRDKRCLTRTCIWSHDELGTASRGERPVCSKTEKHWTPLPLNSGRLWASLQGLAEPEADLTRSLRPRETLTLSDWEDIVESAHSSWTDACGAISNCNWNIRLPICASLAFSSDLCRNIRDDHVAETDTRHAVRDVAAQSRRDRLFRSPMLVLEGGVSRSE